MKKTVKKKVGRKRLKDPRVDQIKVNVNRSEKDYIEKKAEEMGLKVGPYVRNIVMNYKKKLNNEPKVDKEYRNEIRKIGVNLNQISKQLNISRSLDPMEKDRLGEELSRLEKELIRVIKLLKNDRQVSKE